MSDLSNQQVSQESLFQEQQFNAAAYVRSLFENTKITIPEYITIHFLPGWKHVVGDLIGVIGAYPIQLTQMTDSHSILEVKFNVLKPTRGVNIWRAIEHAREESQLTCAQCGNAKELRRHFSAGMFCDQCIKNAGLLGKTGTWLDKY